MLRMNRSALAFRAGRLYRCLDHLDSSRGEDDVECPGELGGAVADVEPDGLAGAVEVHHEVAG